MRLMFWLSLPFTHKSRHSESPGDHMQGALFAGMVVPLQESATQQMAAGRLACLCVYARRQACLCVCARRQARREPLHTGHTCVAALANGTTIGCAPRLGLTHVQGFCDVTYG